MRYTLRLDFNNPVNSSTLSSMIAYKYQSDKCACKFMVHDSVWIATVQVSHSSATELQHPSVWRARVTGALTASQSVNSGNTWSLNALDIGIPDPSQAKKWLMYQQIA